MTTSKFKRFTAFADLSPAEQAALSNLPVSTTSYRRRDVIRYEQDPVDGVYMLMDGWIVATASLADGDRQVLKIHLPGDVVGAPSLPLERAAETITAVTDVVVAKVPAHRLGRIFAEMPRLAMLFFLAAQEERVILMDRLTAVGRHSAKENLAALLIHLHDRVAAPNETGRRSFELPLTQGQIGDVLGIHLVHANRMFRQLRDEGLIATEGKRITLLQVQELRRLTGLPERRLVRNAPWLPPASL